MALERYRQKRDFSKTSEPIRSRPSRTGRSFVVQKHDASHLHYDFRLELDGVLLSWAVPKGPSLDPSVKRLAMQVEDHPVDYGGFEGTIPKGEYGGGTVMVWDRGTWTPEGDPRESYRSGRLTFTLVGEKLRGRWHLVRTRGRSGSRASWLLFKSDDDEARHENGAIVRDAPNSVLTGRTLEQIREGAPRVRKAERGQRTSKTNGRDATVMQSNGNRRQSSEVRLTNPDKVLYPEQKLTKRALAEYYIAVSEHMLPHVRNRPLTLVRCPEGRHRHCFFQKHALEGMPPAIRTIPIAESGGMADYTAIDDVAGLVSLVQMGVLEIHTWGAHEDDPERPDLLVIDLDPDPSLMFNEVARAAHEVRELLEDLGVESFPKTTGGKGLHVCFPVARRIDWDAAKQFCERIARELVRRDPRRYVATATKSKRTGKIFVDYLRNARGATFIAPYSTRARPGAPVATPLDWDEVGPRLRPDRFDVTSVPRRLASLKKDPWARVATLRQNLGAAMKKKLDAG